MEKEMKPVARNKSTCIITNVNVEHKLKRRSTRIQNLQNVETDAIETIPTDIDSIPNNESKQESDKHSLDSSGKRSSYTTSGGDEKSYESMFVGFPPHSDLKPGNNKKMNEGIKGGKYFRRNHSDPNTRTPTSEAKKSEVNTEDVCKVFKIISKQNSLVTSNDIKHINKSPLKTYTNPRKSLEKIEIIESFGLPDNPSSFSTSKNPIQFDKVLDTEILDAKEITIEDLQFVEEPWCVIDLEENYLNFNEIRMKADPQNHLKVCYPTKNEEPVSNDFEVDLKPQKRVNKSHKLVKTSKKVIQNIDETSKKKIVSSGKNTSEVIFANHSLTLEENEVEIFNSSTTHHSADSTSIKTNKLLKINGNFKGLFDQKPETIDDGTPDFTVKRRLRSSSISSDLTLFKVEPMCVRRSDRSVKTSNKTKIITTDDIPRRILRSNSCTDLSDLDKLDSKNNYQIKSPNKLKRSHSQDSVNSMKRKSILRNVKITDVKKISCDSSPLIKTIQIKKKHLEFIEGKQLKVTLCPLKDVDYQKKFNGNISSSTHSSKRRSTRQDIHKASHNREHSELKSMYKNGINSSCEMSSEKLHSPNDDENLCSSPEIHSKHVPLLNNVEEIITDAQKVGESEKNSNLGTKYNNEDQCNDLITNMSGRKQNLTESNDESSPFEMGKNCSSSESINSENSSDEFGGKTKKSSPNKMALREKQVSQTSTELFESVSKLIAGGGRKSKIAANIKLSEFSNKRYVRNSQNFNFAIENSVQSTKMSSKKLLDENQGEDTKTNEVSENIQPRMGQKKVEHFAHTHNNEDTSDHVSNSEIDISKSTEISIFKDHLEKDNASGNEQIKKKSRLENTSCCRNTATCNDTIPQEMAVKDSNEDLSTRKGFLKKNECSKTDNITTLHDNEQQIDLTHSEMLATKAGSSSRIILNDEEIGEEKLKCHENRHKIRIRKGIDSSRQVTDSMLDKELFQRRTRSRTSIGETKIENEIVSPKLMKNYYESLKKINRAKDIEHDRRSVPKTITKSLDEDIEESQYDMISPFGTKKSRRILEIDSEDEIDDSFSIITETSPNKKEENAEDEELLKIPRNDEEKLSLHEIRREIYINVESLLAEERKSSVCNASIISNIHNETPVSIDITGRKTEAIKKIDEVSSNLPGNVHNQTSNENETIGNITDVTSKTIDTKKDPLVVEKNDTVEIGNVPTENELETEDRTLLKSLECEIENNVHADPETEENSITASESNNDLPETDTPIIDDNHSTEPEVEENLFEKPIECQANPHMIDDTSQEIPTKTDSEISHSIPNERSESPSSCENIGTVQTSETVTHEITPEDHANPMTFDSDVFLMSPNDDSTMKSGSGSIGGADNMKRWSGRGRGRGRGRRRGRPKGSKRVASTSGSFVYSETEVQDDYFRTSQSEVAGTDHIFERSLSSGPGQELSRFQRHDKAYLADPKIGDIMWAQIGSFPYWPCIVTTEPVTGIFQRTLVKKRSRIVYHVRFFGDNGKRAWISKKKLIVYNNKDDLKKLCENLKGSFFEDLRPFCIKKHLENRWTNAVDEVEFVKSQNYDFKKIIDFLDRVPEHQEQDDETTSENISVKIESESTGSIEHDAEDEKTKITHIRKKIKLGKDSPSDSHKEKTPRKRKSKQFKDEHTINQLTTTANTNPTEITVKDEISETEYKINVDCFNNFGSYSLEEQRFLFRRNTLFKGVSKDKVCQICFDFGNIVKCKGGCNGIYHPHCATQVLVEKAVGGRKKRSSSFRRDIIAEKDVKEEPNTPGNQSEIDESHVQIITVPSSVCNTPPRKTFPPDFVNMSLAERIDFKMKEIMKKFETTSYLESLSESSSDEKINSPSIKNKCFSRCQDFFSASQRSPQECAILDKELDAISKIDEQSQIEESLEKIFKTPVKHVTADSPGQSPYPNPKNKELNNTLKENCDNQSFEHVTADCDVSNTSITVPEGQHVTADSSFTLLEKIKDEESLPPPAETKLPNGTRKSSSKHVTADSDSVDSESLRSNSSHRSKQSEISEQIDNGSKEFKCGFCLEDIDPYCFICNRSVSKKGCHMRQKCSVFRCSRFYHPDCLRLWPQTQWSLIHTTKNRFSQEELDSCVCPQHFCHTCASDDPRAATARCSGDKIVRCLSCPASYHSSNLCIPAGSEILTSTQIICPRHRAKGRNNPINTTWCFLCNQGGRLICCETCPTSVHPECMTVSLNEDDKFICEDCESGRLPLHDEIVWVKVGKYKWWPGLILFPNEVPLNVRNVKHAHGEFVVKFFGTYDYYWVNRGRSFLFQEGDTLDTGLRARNKVEAVFKKAVEEAVVAHKMKKQFKSIQAAETASSLKPPPYIKIKVSKPVGNVKLMEMDLSNTTACECDPSQSNPCGPDSNCLNRILWTECNPEVCPAGALCKNQSFEKREYPLLVPYKTETRGWGLKALEPIRKGQFVIEYVGELIDDEEYQRRIQKMHMKKEENYYFLTIYTNRMIDAGPKGNIARFMNHCCQPNCETQKWTVNGDTRVGLFATEDIPAHTELTFNYNLECTGTEKKVCKCGAPNCSGYIGVKAKQENSEPKKPKKSYKKKEPAKAIVLPPCFICQKKGNVALCNNKICNKAFHLKCLKLKQWPEGKFVCPWHYCNICSKRTIRCCVKCMNSYCPSHSEGKVRYDNLMGFVCNVHEPPKPENTATPLKKKRVNMSSEDAVVSSTTDDNDDDYVPLRVKQHKVKRSKRNNLAELSNDNVIISQSCTSFINEDDVSSNVRRHKVKRSRRNNLGELSDDNGNVSQSFTESSGNEWEEESQDETVSSATASDFEEELKQKRKKKPKNKMKTKRLKLKVRTECEQRKIITAGNDSENVLMSSDAAR